jgi:hypothetical protein
MSSLPLASGTTPEQLIVALQASLLEANDAVKVQRLKSVGETLILYQPNLVPPIVTHLLPLIKDPNECVRYWMVGLIDDIMHRAPLELHQKSTGMRNLLAQEASSFACIASPSFRIMPYLSLCIYLQWRVWLFSCWQIACKIPFLK